MARRKKVPPRPEAVEVTADGVRYAGWYTVENGCVTVSSDLGSKTTQIGGSTGSVVARMLLHELVRETAR